MFDKKWKPSWGTPPKQPFYKKRGVIASTIGVALLGVTAFKNRDPK